MAGTFPNLSPCKLIKMATVNAARALGREGQLGQLSPGATADLIAVPFAGSKRQADEALVYSQGKITASIIDGRWAIPPQLQT